MREEKQIMSDKVLEIVKALIIAAAVIIAAIILGDAIKQAGWYIIEGLNNIASNIATSFPQ
jgi:hypothetical protein